MAFNLKSAKVIKESEETVHKRLVRKYGLDKKYIIYIIRFYKVFDHPSFDVRFRIMVWSRIDRRYICDISTNNIEGRLDSVIKQYKKKDSIVMDLRDATEKEISQKYRLR